MADKPKPPDPSMLGDGMAAKAGDAIKKHNEYNQQQMNEIAKELGEYQPPKTHPNRNRSD